MARLIRCDRCKKEMDTNATRFEMAILENMSDDWKGKTHLRKDLCPDCVKTIENEFLKGKMEAAGR